MRAVAHIVAEADGRGGTRLTRLYGEAPLLPRRTGPHHVHLVGGAAGPLGGDRLRIEVEVGPGARLCLRTVAAAVALPGTGAPSRVEVHARVAGGASLAWLPEPLVAAAGCDHQGYAEVECDDDARLRWREELVRGRHGEAAGPVTLTLRVRRGGRTLLHQELAPTDDSPAVLGANRTAGSVLLVNPLWIGAALVPSTVDDGALMPLAGPALLATAVAPDAVTLRRRLDTLTAPDRLPGSGHDPATTHSSG